MGEHGAWGDIAEAKIGIAEERRIESGDNLGSQGGAEAIIQGYIG
jgi:hypothetical protein